MAMVSFLFFIFADKSHFAKEAKRKNILFTAIYGRHINRPHIAHFYSLWNFLPGLELR